MNTQVTAALPRANPPRTPAPTFALAADAALRAAARFWFVVAVMGQWIFAYYLFSAYGRGALSGDFESWNKAMSTAHIAGEHLGNLAVITHVLLGFAVMTAGALQLVPQLRARFPTFHRWNGRMYLSAVLLACIAGIYMSWVRNATMGLPVKIGATSSAALMLIFGSLALRDALRGRIASHRRWALRLFLTASAAWFFRIMLMVWIMLNGGEPVGIDFSTGRGPFLNVMAFGQYLIPLAILELYFRAQERGGTTGRWFMASALSILTLAMGAGIAAATFGMWMPFM